CFIDPSCLSRLTITPNDLAGKLTPLQIQYTLCMFNQTAGFRNLPEPMATCAAGWNGANATTLAMNGCQVTDLYTDFNSTLVQNDAFRSADLVCQARLGTRAPLPNAQELVGAVDPSCFRGKLGAAALQIIAANQDIDLARQNVDLAQQSFQL